MVTTILIVAMYLVAFPVSVAGEPVMTGQAPVDSNSEQASSAGSVDSSRQKELDLVLLGTVLHDPGKPMAIIQIGKTGNQELLWLGDIVEGGRITKILRDRVTLTFEDIEIDLQLTGGARGTPTAVAANTGSVQPPLSRLEHGFWHIKRENLDQLSSTRELIREVTLLDAGGVRIDKVQADGLFHMLGLKTGDIISNINGQVPDADLTLKQLIEQTEMGETMLRIEIDRQGEFDVVYFEIDP